MTRSIQYIYSQLCVACIDILWSLAAQNSINFLLKYLSIPCPHSWCGPHMYIFCQNSDFNRPVGCNTIWSLAIKLFWSLVELPDVPLMHYGKREIVELISSMEPEFKLILRWTRPLPSEAPGVSSQWGHSITVAGDPKRVTGSRRKSFMADMYGFSTNGELTAVCNYLRAHGGYEIEQVP